MKMLIVFASVAVASGLLFTNMYTSLVDTVNWGSNLPQSIETTRSYFKAADPGNFFRLFSPLNQVLALLALILFWKASPGVRLYLGIAFIWYVLGDVLTFAYFYPRNDTLFKSTPLPDTDTLARIIGEWKLMNWVRTAIVFVGLCCTCFSLHKLYLLRGTV
jgi:hypothetical protein